MNKIKLSAVGLILVALGFLGGKYSAPEKLVIDEVKMKMEVERQVALELETLKKNTKTSTEETYHPKTGKLLGRKTTTEMQEDKLKQNQRAEERGREELSHYTKTQERSLKGSATLYKSFPNEGYGVDIGYKILGPMGIMGGFETSPRETNFKLGIIFYF